MNNIWTKKQYCVIGIDPGITGAIATVNQDKLIITLADLPTYTATKSKKQLNAAELTNMMKSTNIEAKVYIEKVGAMPKQGVVSMFNFGKTCGIIEGVCAALQMPYEYVTPQKWKKAAGLIGQDKDYSRTIAIQQYPEVASRLKRKKDIGRADALHIAMYGYERIRNGNLISSNRSQ